MRDAVIVSALRTPIGTALKGMRTFRWQKPTCSRAMCARMIAALVHEMRRRGGGMGSATVIAVPAP